MKSSKTAPTGREQVFGEDEIIVSKTDLRGVITYANDVFQRVSLYSESELLGQPHNLIRHPDMPATVFKLLWDTLQQRQEIFAYVLNLARDGSHYWVFAHVTPSYDPAGRHVGYHSSRRSPFRDALPKVQSLYDQLNAAERAHANKREGIAAGTELLNKALGQAKMTYSQFVFTLSSQTRLTQKP
ncbi:MAG: PAS domain-containing protein [Opitutaceae bacterium]|nr:PAS domain-containing protein [Opitutaceae bacterium]